MARYREISIFSARIIWILLLFLAGSVSRKSETYYMDGDDCGEGRLISGAIVLSHMSSKNRGYYSNNIECRITFKAVKDNWKLMMRVLELDIPDKSFSELCNDALYVYDAHSIGEHALPQVGGNGGLCGTKLPPVIISSGPYLTIYFRTDGSGPKGSGFKIIITAFSEELDEYNSCGPHFQCGSQRCIDEELVCDTVDHCFDFSDESIYSGATCKDFKGDSFLDKFLSLGITAAISITVGTVVVSIVCIVCVICCCCKCLNNKRPEVTHTTASATSVTINNSAPSAPAVHSYQGGEVGFEESKNLTKMTISKNETRQKEAAPVQSTYHPTSHHSYHPPYLPQGYYQLQQIAPPPSSMPVHQVQQYSPYPLQREACPSNREAYSQVSGYSSQPPPSYHRSYTPTSSRSGRSIRSSESAVKISGYSSDKVVLPVNV